MRSKAYTFTINNYTEDDESKLRNLEGVRYMVCGRECGKEGTPHLQGTLLFPNARSFKAVSKLLPRAHLEICRNVGRSIPYCKKEGNFWEIGIEPQKIGGDKMQERIEKNKRLRDNSIEESLNNGDICVTQVPLLKKAKYILAQEGEAIQCEGTRGKWYYGPPGVGKSHTAQEEHPDAYRKAQNKWWDGYEGQKAVILDDLDTNILGHYLKIWSDKWKCSGEVKGGTIPLKHEVFVVTSNYHPDDLWEEDVNMREAIKRRFKITHFNDLHKNKLPDN